MWRKWFHVRKATRFFCVACRYDPHQNSCFRIPNQGTNDFGIFGNHGQLDECEVCSVPHLRRVTKGSPAHQQYRKAFRYLVLHSNGRDIRSTKQQRRVQCYLCPWKCGRRKV